MYSLIMVIMLGGTNGSSVSNTTIDTFANESLCNVAAYQWAGKVTKGLLPPSAGATSSSISIVGLCVKTSEGK